MSPRSLLFVCVLSLTTVTHADVLFNNFGATPPGYDTANGYAVAPNFESVAVPFIVPSGQYEITSVKLALWAGPTRNYNVSIAKATPSILPGATLTSWTVSQAVGQDIFTLSPSSSLLLDAGVYYLVAEGAPGSTVGEWFWCLPHQSGSFALWNGSWHGAQFGMPAYTINANPVPEPASLLAFGGLTPLALRRTKRRKK